MRIGVPKETLPGERRVALVPSALAALTKAKFSVVIESGAGEAAGFADREYREKGAEIGASRAAVFGGCDIVLQVRTYGANKQHGADDLSLLSSRHVLIGMGDPLSEAAAQQRIAETGATSFALELIPRITRAQSMDVLSSMATIAGYKAVLLAANTLPRLFPLMMTAAGTMTPAKAFVIGAGVAGLQAISTARRLGAVVSAYDVRPAVKEQVQSVGARFVELPLESAEGQGGYARDQGEDFLRRQRELMTKVVAEHDVIITTAAIPGKRSPVLITDSMVSGMKACSVIIDLAAERGGNCELTIYGQEIVRHGVTINGPANLPATIPTHASQLYARNICNFLTSFANDGELTKLTTDEEIQKDEVLRDTLVTRGGSIVNARVRAALGMPTAPQPI
ncbi:MAG: Re/Si-specific NAD(P)(+) transhydrogenase subunit alpha [Planctomycetota bacterium]